MEYFLLVNKQKVGPFSEKDLLRGLKAQKISLFDMVFNQQTNEWIMLMQHPDFSNIESDYDEDLDQGEESLGLLSEGGAQAPRTSKGMFSEEITSFHPVLWYLKSERPAGLKFLVVLSMINSHQISEQTLIAQNSSGPWKPLIDWPDFSLASRAEYRKTTSTPVPEVNLRRQSPRITFGKNLLVLTREKVSRVFCLDVSKSGMSLILRIDLYTPGEEIYVKFKDDLEDKHFDLKAKVISARKVSLPGYTEEFVRYGVRFTHLTTHGRSTLKNLEVYE